MRTLLAVSLLALGCSESHDGSREDAASALDATTPRDAFVPRDGPSPCGSPPRCLDTTCCTEEADPIVDAVCMASCPTGFELEELCDPAAECADFAAPCSRHDECALAITDCCGPCGLPSLDDFDAIRASRAADHMAFVCPDPGGTDCPDCVTFDNPSLGARCEAGRCQGYDVRRLPLSECASDAQCRVRTRDCCECGGATDRASLVAVRVGSDDYATLICDDLACPECAPAYPSSVEAFCAPDGHCDLRDVP